jgi:prepilin-type processing-associated H-X9-DG protein
LINKGFLDSKALHCLSDPSEAESSYVYWPPGREESAGEAAPGEAPTVPAPAPAASPAATPEETLLVLERLANHRDRRMALFQDGHCEALTPSRLQELLNMPQDPRFR